MPALARETAPAPSAFVSRRHGHRVGRAIATMLVVMGTAGRAAAACPPCGTSPCTIAGTSTITSGAVCNYAGKSVTVTGKLLGDGNADCYTIIADNLTVRGTLRARGSCIAIQVTGDFKTEVVGTSDAKIDVSAADDDGDGLFVTCGSATLNGKVIDADSDGTPTGYAFGGTIAIECTGNVTGNGDAMHAVGLGGDSAGDIAIASATGSVSLGTAFDASANGTGTIGGFITLEAAGSITVGTPSRSIQAQSYGVDTDGGLVDICAGDAVTINGAINVNGNGADANGGTITIDAASVTTGTTWNARGDANGSGGTIAVDAQQGAGTVTTTIGNASWNVVGDVDGGTIAITAAGDIVLAGDMDAGGTGLESFAGDIDIQTSGDITVASTSRLEADATGVDAADGSIHLLGCDVTVAGVVDTRQTGTFGWNLFDAAGTFTQLSGSSITTNDFGMGNQIACRCLDVVRPEGICDPPATCVSPPVLSGSATPVLQVIPTALPACS